MPTLAPRHPVHADLANALEVCRRALADYEAGLLDDAQLRRSLFRGGLVLSDHEVWVLDLAEGRWWRYDGLGVTTAPDGGVDHLARFDAERLAEFGTDHLAGLRRGIAAMAAAIDADDIQNDRTT